MGRWWQRIPVRFTSRSVADRREGQGSGLLTGRESSDGVASPVASDDLGTDLIPEDVFHETVLTFLNAQISSSDVLDGKASQALGVGTASLPLTIALVNATGSDLAERPLWHWDRLPIALFALALLCYVLILVWNREIGRKPGIQFKPAMLATMTAYEETRTQPLGGRGLKSWVARYYVESMEANQAMLADKSRLVARIQTTLAVEGAALAIGAALALTL